MSTTDWTRQRSKEEREAHTAAARRRMVQMRFNEAHLHLQAFLTAVRSGPTCEDWVYEVHLIEELLEKLGDAEPSAEPLKSPELQQALF